MEKLLSWIHVNPDLYSRLNAAEKNLIIILALSAPVSSLVAGVVFFYSIDLLLETPFLAFLGSSFIALLLFLHDSTLLSEAGTGRAVFRLVLSVLIAVVVAIPLKIKFMGEGIEDRYLSEVSSYNLKMDEDLMAAKQGIFGEEKEILESVRRGTSNYERTGNSSSMMQAQGLHEAFMASKDERIASLEKLYKAKKQPAKVSKLDLAGFFFTNMFSKSSPKELFINLTVFILLLLAEALPPIVRLKLEGGKYVSKIIHKTDLKDKTDNEVETVEKDILNMDNLQDLPNKLEKVRIWKELEKVSDNGFKDTDKLIELTKKFNEKNGKTPSPPPPTNSKSKGKEAPEFDYKD